MNTDTKQWYAGPPTPIAWSEMKPAIVGDTCYFMGGWIQGSTNKMYSVSLPALVSTLIVLRYGHTDMEGATSTASRVCCSTLHQSLLALKGWEEDGISNALHLYQPDARKWVKVADMPTKGQTPTCIMITDNELLVAGGWHKSHLATMDIAQVL